MIFNMMNYGGGAGSLEGAYAVVTVTYPSGSECTCYKGTDAMTAADTSGHAFFAIPSSGQWTLSCTDGNDTASYTFTPEQYGVYEVILSYDEPATENYIFKAGEGPKVGIDGTSYTLNSGGMQESGSYTVFAISISPSNLFAGAIIGTTAPITLSEQKTMKATFGSWNLVGTADLIRVGYSESKTIETDTPPAGVSPSNGTTISGSNTTVSLTVPAGTYYFYVYVLTNRASATIVDWHLE